MFPEPITRRRPAVRAGYYLLVLAVLAVWLLPLAGVALTSIHSAEDLNRGNFWGWPSEFRPFANYLTVLSESHTAQFALNSVLVTVPTVLATVLISSMAGFALA